MWALDGLAGVFDWAASRFWELADWSRWASFWAGPWYIQPFGWLEPPMRGLANFCWVARDRIHDFDRWIDGQLADLRLNVYYLKEWVRLEIEYRVRQIVDGLLGGIELLRQKAEDAWNKATELWNVFWGYINPTVDWLGIQFGSFKAWVENSALPWLQTQVINLGTRLDQARADLGSRIDYQRQRLDELNPFRESWEFIRNSYEKIRFTFTDGWGKLGAFLTDPPGSIWAWLEPILLRRLEQFFNERWDNPL